MPTKTYGLYAYKQVLSTMAIQFGLHSM